MTLQPGYRLLTRADYSELKHQKLSFLYAPQSFDKVNDWSFGTDHGNNKNTTLKFYGNLHMVDELCPEHG